MNTPLRLRFVLSRLRDAGLEFGRDPDGTLLVWPSERITDELRAMIKDQKNNLVDYLIQIETLTNELINTAMRRCDQFNDSQQARENMRRDCINTPDHLKPDLLRHFNEALRKPSDNQNRD